MFEGRKRLEREKRKRRIKILRTAMIYKNKLNLTSLNHAEIIQGKLEAVTQNAIFFLI